MQELPFTLARELEGWTLYCAELKCGDADDGALKRLREEVAERARGNYRIESLSSHPTVAAMRRLFKSSGCDPTRYRPASEALLRRLLKGAEMPAIHPLVDVNNCLSAELAVPCCVMAAGTFEADFTLRAGGPGESYESLRGPFNLEGKPLLCDSAGPLDSPITGNVRVRVDSGTDHAWLVAYLPAEALDAGTADERLRSLLQTLPGIELSRSGSL